VVAAGGQRVFASKAFGESEKFVHEGVCGEVGGGVTAREAAEVYGYLAAKP
jgi:hypothetical protein